MALYLAVFLLSFGGRPIGDQTGLGTLSTTLLVAPILIFGSLAAGTRERFGTRTTAPLRSWIAYAILGVGFLGLMVATVAGLSYPWWLNLAVPGALFIVMASGPIRKLRRAHPDDEPWPNAPLSPPARRVTAIIGVALGVAAALSSQPWFAFVQLPLMLLLMGSLIAYRTRWGLPQVGIEWGPLHWRAFGVVTGILFGLCAILTRTDWASLWLTIPLGVVVTTLMVSAAILPRRARD